jgi:large subunit ribosomal protein L21
VAGIPVETLIEDAPPAPVAIQPDDLEVINGIGPVFAGRLRAAGIETFAQLAELTPDRIREIIAPIRSSHMIDAEGWIAEARTLSERKT